MFMRTMTVKRAVRRKGVVDNSYYFLFVVAHRKGDDSRHSPRAFGCLSRNRPLALSLFIFIERKQFLRYNGQTLGRGQQKSRCKGRRKKGGEATGKRQHAQRHQQTTRGATLEIGTPKSFRDLTKYGLRRRPRKSHRCSQSVQPQVAPNPLRVRPQLTAPEAPITALFLVVS